eukprot:462783-Amorphochlora_amoeboformis.AAC.1
MEILEIVGRSYHPVAPCSIRQYPVVTGFLDPVTERDVTSKREYPCTMRVEFKPSIGPLSILPLR